MSVELGHYALILALVVGLVQGVVPLIGAARRDAAWMAVAAPAAQAQFAATLVAFLTLTLAYLGSDFSVGNVAANSHTEKPLLYKITGVWGNHEGSMLLWVMVTALFGAAVGWFGGALPASLRARVIAVQGLIGAGVTSFVLFTSNPFLRLEPAPLQGRGLNPILQDPGLAFHPPLLYLGYVGFSLTFSFAIAALLEGRVDAAWARWVRPWTLAAWAFLTGGIALGSWWAYYELGWGGWWFWDPVENASLMPWLLGTALLHSAIVVEKRDCLKRWTILLAILTFAMALVGTFLVRSGVITSVHAFAVDPARGLYILGLLIVVVGVSLGLYAWRAPMLEPGGLFAPVSREGTLVLNNLLLSTSTVTILLGTLYPLIMDAMGGGNVSVGAPYYNAVFIPLMVPLVAAVSIGPMMAWKRGDLLGALGRLKFIAALSVLAALVTLYLQGGGPVLGVVGMACALWLIGGAVMDLIERSSLFRVGLAKGWRRLAGLPGGAFGTALAHAGLGISILGMTGALWNTEVIKAVKPGESFDIAGYHIQFIGVSEVPSGNYTATRAEMIVSRDGQMLDRMYPSKRKFTMPPMSTTEAAIRTTGATDLYLALGDLDPSGNGAWAVRAYHNPLAPLIWSGALVMMFGGLVSLFDRRLRFAVGRRATPRGAAVKAG